MASTTDIPADSALKQDDASFDEGLKRKMTIALCDGIFAYAFKETATKVHEKCLKLCGGSQELLSKIVQTRFLNDHSPLYMILANRLLGDDPQPADRAVPLRQTVPPLFNMLIQCSDLEATTQDDLLEVILRESAHQLYSALQAHLPKFSRPTPLSVFEDKTSFSSLGNNFFSFTIPKMGDRLMLREEISFQFVAQRTLWRLELFAHKVPLDSWGIRMQIIRPTTPKAHYFDISIELHAQRTDPDRESSRSSWNNGRSEEIEPSPSVRQRSTVETSSFAADGYFEMSPFSGEYSSICSNPLFSGKDRQVTGKITLDKVRKTSGIAWK